VSACSSAPVASFSVYALLEPARTLSTTANACRDAVLTAANAYAPTAPDTCSNGVLLLGGSVNNYAVCPRNTSATACPAACVTLLASLPTYCNASSLITLPAAALSVYGVTCVTATCTVGNAGFSLPLTAAQLRLPSVCTLPTLPPGPPAAAPSAAPARSAALALAAAAACAAALL
jgi:hypothetical protein